MAVGPRMDLLLYRHEFLYRDLVVPQGFNRVNTVVGHCQCPGL